jgi:hypothetical protein
MAAKAAIHAVRPAGLILPLQTTFQAGGGAACSKKTPPGRFQKTSFKLTILQRRATKRKSDEMLA